MSFTRRILLLLVLSALAVSVHASPVFRNGDRIVFYGDSITEQRLYTRYVQQYLMCRYPEMNLTFFNAGWSGDTVTGANDRLERDVLYLKPTLVTLFFGMNDGGYRSPDAEVTKRYRDGLERLITRFKTAGVRVVVFSPGCVDDVVRKDFAQARYNSTLEGLTRNAFEAAEKYHVPFGDIYHPMLEFQKKQRAGNAHFSMISDGIHPDRFGHMLIALQMIKAMGAEPAGVIGSIDVSAGNATGGLKILSRQPGRIEFESAQPIGTSFWFPAVYERQRALACGLLDFASPAIVIKNLPEGSYGIYDSGGTLLRGTSSQELSHGVAITDLKGPSENLFRVIDAKEEHYYDAWRHVRLVINGMTGADEVIRTMSETQDQLGKMAQKFSQAGQALHLTVAQLNSGNLALRRPYIESDPCQSDWGFGGLTDGSWETNERHCYVSGESREFPKHVTVDLGGTFRIDRVIYGNTHFGCTKQVDVAVSLDGASYRTVGSHEFLKLKDEKYTLNFQATEARYVRLIYMNHYDAFPGSWPFYFVFTSELEVYEPQK